MEDSLPGDCKLPPAGPVQSHQLEVRIPFLFLFASHLSTDHPHPHCHPPEFPGREVKEPWRVKPSYNQEVGFGRREVKVKQRREIEKLEKAPRYTLRSEPA